MSADARQVLKQVDQINSRIRDAERIQRGLEDKGSSVRVNNLDVPRELLPAIKDAVTNQIGKWEAEAMRLEDSVQVVGK